MKSKQQKNTSSSLGWLPVDSRLIPPIFSFSHVHGAAKIFLTVEMILALGVVIGTLAVMILHYLA